MCGKGLKTHLKYLSSYQSGIITFNFVVNSHGHSSTLNYELFDIKTISIPFDQFYAILIKNRDFKLKMAKNRPNVVCLVPTPLRI